MNMLPPKIKMAFKQISYSDKLIKYLVSKIIYRENLLTYFINIEDTDYLKPFKGDYGINTKSEKLKGAYLKLARVIVSFTLLIFYLFVFQ